MKTPLAKVHNEKHETINKWGVFSDDFGRRRPVIQKTFSDEKCYLYRSTRVWFSTPYDVRRGFAVLKGLSSKLQLFFPRPFASRNNEPSLHPIPGQFSNLSTQKATDKKNMVVGKWVGRN